MPPLLTFIFMSPTTNKPLSRTQTNAHTIKELSEGLDTIIARISLSYDAHMQCRVELGDFVTKSGGWGKAEVWAAAERMPAWKWWLVNSHLAPSLAVRGYAQSAFSFCIGLRPA